MRVAWQLRRKIESEPADAILLPSDNSAELLAILAQLGPGQANAIYPTQYGWLVKLSSRSNGAFPQVIRLRAYAENFLIPVSAELIPALHPEEARALVRDLGLIILPHSRVLTFVPGNPVPLSSFLEVPEVQRPRWIPFPEPRAWASQIERILLDQPDDPELDILAPGGEGIGCKTDHRRTSALRYRIIAWLFLMLFVLLLAVVFIQASNVPSRLGSSDVSGVAVFLLLLALGLLLFAKYLARPTARLVNKSVAAVPFLQKSVTKQQDAAIQGLLRKFRAGKIDEALRHAVPISSAVGRGSDVATSPVE